MANVLETVTTLIANWPTLYPNRASALKHVFTSPRWQWIDGELLPEHWSEIERGDTPQHEEIDGDLDQRLSISKRNAIIDWTVSNAEHLAQDTMSVPEHKCLWLPDSYDRFADMPEDVADDWREAAVQMLRQLYHDTKDAKQGSHEYSAHRTLTGHMIHFGLLDPHAHEQKIIEAWADLEAVEANLRSATEALWYPRIDAALAGGEDEFAMELVTRIPDMVTKAFAMDKIREWRKAQG